MYFFGHTDYRRKADVIVVFGARAHADGSPSGVLSDRVTTACQLYRDGLADMLIFSGGPGDGDIDEPHAMRRLAMKLGVPDSAIRLDSAGLNTDATVGNTEVLFRQLHVSRVLAVSNFYHLPRIKMAYRQAGWDVYTQSLSCAAFSPAGGGAFSHMRAELVAALGVLSAPAAEKLNNHLRLSSSNSTWGILFAFKCPVVIARTPIFLTVPCRLGLVKLLEKECSMADITTNTSSTSDESSSGSVVNERAVVATFDDRVAAEYAIDALEQAGFTHDHVGFVIRGTDVAAGGMLSSADGAKDMRGAAAGIITGGIVGGILATAAAVR